MGPYIARLLGAGVSAVPDFDPKRVESLRWMRAWIDEAGPDNQLHVPAPPDTVCLARLHRRNASGAHPFVVSEERFHQISKCFVPSTWDEGFTLVFHDALPKA